MGGKRLQLLSWALSVPGCSHSYYLRVSPAQVLALKEKLEQIYPSPLVHNLLDVSNLVVLSISNMRTPIRKLSTFQATPLKIPVTQDSHFIQCSSSLSLDWSSCCHLLLP